MEKDQTVLCNAAMYVMFRLKSLEKPKLLLHFILLTLSCRVSNFNAVDSKTADKACK
jgi:hypothetical protein